MTDTLARTDARVRPCGVATIVGGAVIAVLGIVAAAAPTLVGGAWFATVVPAVLLLAAGILGVQRLAAVLGASGLVTRKASATQWMPACGVDGASKKVGLKPQKA